MTRASLLTATAHEVSSLVSLHFPDDWNEERSDEWNEEQFRNETRAETGLEWPVSARTKVFSLKA